MKIHLNRSLYTYPWWLLGGSQLDWQMGLSGKRNKLVCLCFPWIYPQTIVLPPSSKVLHFAVVVVYTLFLCYLILGYTWLCSGFAPDSELKGCSWQLSRPYMMLWIEHRSLMDKATHCTVVTAHRAPKFRCLPRSPCLSRLNWTGAIMIRNSR